MCIRDRPKLSFTNSELGLAFSTFKHLISDHLIPRWLPLRYTSARPLKFFICPSISMTLYFSPLFLAVLVTVYHWNGLKYWHFLQLTQWFSALNHPRFQYELFPDDNDKLCQHWKFSLRENTLKLSLYFCSGRNSCHWKKEIPSAFERSLIKLINFHMQLAMLLAPRLPMPSCHM